LKFLEAYFLQRPARRCRLPQALSGCISSSINNAIMIETATTPLTLSPHSFQVRSSVRGLARGYYSDAFSVQ